MGHLDRQGRSHDHPDPEHMGRSGCRACEDRLRDMGVEIQYRIGVLSSSKWTIGEWLKHEGANPHPPHFRDLNPMRQQVHVIWADKEQTIPVAVEDDDGCQAIIQGESRES